MVSYLDVLTILLIFFVTAAAASLKKMSASANPPATESTNSVVDRQHSSEKPVPKIEAPRDPQELHEIGRKLKEQGLDAELLPEDSTAAASGNVSGKALAIHLPQTVVFAPGNDRVQPEALPDLEKIADALLNVPNKVNLAGHADATPIHNRRFKNNWDLAAARSLRLMEVLTERFGVDPSRVSISSYGALEPKSPNSTSSGRASNRRVEILVYAQ